MKGIPAARRRGSPHPREAAWRAAIAVQLKGATPLEGLQEYEVEAEFVLPRDPAEELNPDAIHGADLDNLAKVLLDELKPILPAGDGAVMALRVSKRRATGDEPSGARVSVR